MNRASVVPDTPQRNRSNILDLLRAISASLRREIQETPPERKTKSSTIRCVHLVELSISTLFCQVSPQGETGLI